jgi:tetratricopeptide (TPR) repeat protein
VSDEYKNSGQAGAVGDHADVHDNTFNQITNAENSEVKQQLQGQDNTAVGGNVNDSNIITGDHNVINKITRQDAPFTPSALHQLPPPPRDFVGRKKEMTELLKALEKSGVTISGLQGLGGVGKTALALKLAEHLEPQYPDAQFYLDLKGASKHPLTAGEAMAHVIRAYYPTAQLPEDEGSVRTIYLSELKGKKALLLMDNAAGRGQIEPLIPPPGCVLLVTSRNHFILNGLVAKNLEALEARDAKQLLLKIAPRIGKCAEKIAELCGYLPLALELAASALHKFVMLTPEEYVQRLSDATKRLELVEASLSLSYDLLTEELQKLWRMLAVFPNTFDTAAVAALWELEVEEAQERLAELISYSLVEWSDTTRRYQLHDLVRLFADARMDESQALAARKTHATYFRDLLVQTDELYREGGAQMLAGLSLFDLERENIEAGQKWSATLISKDETATKLSMRYYSGGWCVLELRLHPHEKINWLELSLKAARLLEDKGNEGNALCNLGIVYADLGEPRKAIEHHQQYLEIAREIGYRYGEGRALGSLGAVYADLGETRKAIQFYEQRLAIAREISDRDGEGAALGNLGVAYKDLGETRKAIEFHEQLLAIAQEIGDRRNEGAALGNLGIAYKDLGETRKAIQFYEQYLAIAREIGDRRGEGNALGNLGTAYADLGETRKAIQFYEQALQIDREIGDRRGEGRALWNSALAYKGLGDRTQAISLAEKALEIFEQIEAPGIAEDRATVDSWKAEEA